MTTASLYLTAFRRLTVRPTRSFSIPVVAFAAIGLLGSAAGTSRERPMQPVAPSPAEQREVGRIRAHFDSVLNELSAAAAPIDSTAPRRAALIETLRTYRDRGVFPHNYDFPGRAVPYFVDRKTGTLCAVAHLLEVTGRRDIVDRVTRSNNNVWVAELASDSAFTGWLTQHGITLAEAARIQVPYIEPETPAQVARNRAFIVAAPIALGSATVTGLLNAFGNADGHQRASRVIGFTSGLASVGIGTMLMTKSGQPRQIGAMTTVVGSLSVALAVRATGRHKARVAAQRDAERSREAVQASLSPMVGGASSGTGLALSIRY